MVFFFFPTEPSKFDIMKKNEKYMGVEMDKKAPLVSVKDLKQGDIILAKLVFEENTSDYYHGHRVYDVISHSVTDANGNTSKLRPVIYMGSDGNDMFVAPMTSKHGAKADAAHQLQLEDTKSAQRTKDGSYVEMTNMRKLYMGDDWTVPLLDHIGPNDFKRLNERYQKDAERFAHHLDWKNAYIYLPDKEAYHQRLEKAGYEQTDFGWQKDKHQIIEKGDFIMSHQEVSLEDTLKAHHPRSHLTMRSSAERAPLSPQVDLLLDDVRALLQPIPLDLTATTHIPGGLDAMTTPGRTRIQTLAATDHGAVSELGFMVLKLNKLDTDLLPEFVTWYEETHGLEVVDPVEVKTDFSGLGLSSLLQVQDLPENDTALSQ